MEKKSLFITFEGIEGSGKSTQATLLDIYLKDCGFDTLLLREPGGTVIGEKLREILLNGESTDIHPRTELLMYEAARVEIMDKVIKPAIAEGKTIILDRFFDSTLAYQGFARGLDKERINSLNQFASFSITPDLTFFIDVTVEVGLKRAWGRIKEQSKEDIRANKEDRFEKEGTDFHNLVRDGFLAIAAEEERFVTINGERSIEEIEADIKNTIEEKLK